MQLIKSLNVRLKLGKLVQLLSFKKFTIYMRGLHRLVCNLPASASLNNWHRNRNTNNKLKSNKRHIVLTSGPRLQLPVDLFHCWLRYLRQFCFLLDSLYKWQIHVGFALQKESAWKEEVAKYQSLCFINPAKKTNGSQGPHNHGDWAVICASLHIQLTHTHIYIHLEKTSYWYV